MKFTYRAEGLDPRTWPLELDDMPSHEAEAIERATKMTFGEFAGALERNSMIALRALVWTLLRRDKPALKFDQVSIKISEVDLELELADKIEARDNIKRALAEGVYGEVREKALETLEQLEAEIAAEQPPEEISDVGDDEVAEVSEVPKAGLSSAPSTGAHSVTPGAGIPVSSTG